LPEGAADWWQGRFGDPAPAPNDGPPTMLGPVQKAWLKDSLRRSDATFKVLVSSVPFDFRTKGNSPDTWNGYRDERDELFGYLAEHGIEGVVLISADRHRSDAWRIRRPDAYDLYEFNSSRLTNHHVHETKEKAIFSYNETQSFGVVDFDTYADDPTVTYKVVNIDGEQVHDLTLKRSQLQHEPEE
jgi:alkaline phosphatase D